MRVISFNVNGIRSAASKGFFPWMQAQKADVICLQELKAHECQLTGEILAPQGYHSFFHCAEKKGYSGVGLYCAREPDNVRIGLGIPDFDVEGRYIQADFGKLSIISLYLPSGSSGELRQAVKFHFMDEFLPVLQKLRADGREYIVCGDWNIAHKEIDLKNWRSNQKNSGFLPQERAWMTHILEELAWVDVFRTLNPGPEQYTWWSNRGQAWDKNVGWRIDYHIATPGIAGTAEAESIYKRTRFSDHAPLIIDYAATL